MVEKWRKYGYQLGYAFLRHARRWMTEEECLNTAVEGLWEAARRFQPGKGVQFGTYAKWWVRQTLYRAKRRAIGLPAHLVVGSDKADAAMRVCVPISYTADYGSDGERSLAGTIAEPTLDAPCFPPDFWDRVNKYLQPRLQEVIRLRYVDDMTLEEVGEVLGITRERVRQLEKKALDMIERRVDFGDVLDQFTFTEHALV